MSRLWHLTEQRKEFGKRLNELKTQALDKIEELKSGLANETSSAASGLDLTRSAEPVALGARHPVSLVKNRIIEIFSRVGFTLSDGPEIEDDWHNFTALNTPEEHPARDMQDTFFIQSRTFSIRN